MRRILGFAFLGPLLTAMVILAQSKIQNPKSKIPLVPSSLDQFRYRPEAIKVGEVAHYIKSNLDGSKPTRVSIFVAAPDRLEVAKVEKNVDDAAWVRAHFDWKLFTADKLDAAVINLDGPRSTWIAGRGSSR